MLNEQLQLQIEQEALQFSDSVPNCAPHISWRNGATKYAELWQAAEQWKKEASLLLNPLLEWGQAQKDMPLGVSITAEILRRAKLWQAAEAKADRYEKALKEIMALPKPWNENPFSDLTIRIATEALTHKTSDDERRL